MRPLPVIVGFGGFNAAGRASFHHSYRRTIYDSLSTEAKQVTVGSLAALMGLAKVKNNRCVKLDGSKISEKEYSELEKKVLDGTLVRKLSQDHFDSGALSQTVSIPSEGARLVLDKSKLPADLPEGWKLIEENNDSVILEISSDLGIKSRQRYALAVQSAGQLPNGFKPGDLYKSRFHPKGLQLAIAASSDAIKSIGIGWEDIKQLLHPDQIAVYSASAMAQLDGHGTGGMLQARLKGKRVSSKQLPLGLNTMPADFINAYVLGNIGTTGANAGACATFLYNLRMAVEDIQEGRRKVVIVGNAEAPLEPEVIEGYAAMSALATDSALKKIDGSEIPDHRRASRPFGDNCGFTLGESGQYFVLMDDSLAIELGAKIYSGILPVFINADGFKKSISAPGPGNYITLAKAVAAAKAIFGSKIACNRSFIQAHGSSTPQNRVTESHIFDTVAKAFGITDWPVTAVKAFVGHSLAPASADQLSNTLGVMEHAILPGIKTINSIAEDVFEGRLSIALKDTDIEGRAQIGFLNSKGFGGNNATGTVIAPKLAESMLAKRHGDKVFSQYQKRKEKVEAQSAEYDSKCLGGEFEPIYHFGENLIEEKDISINETEIQLRGATKNIPLIFENTYKDMF